MNATFNYNFPALKGYQANKEYFVVMCPLKLIPKIFLFDEEEVPVEYRAQRIINKGRIPEITEYIVHHPEDYVFSSLTASVDGEMSFEPFNDHPNYQNLGQLSISLESRFLINDGQHRRAAIEEALKLAPELGNETISVVFFQDAGLKRSQQIFSDLNRHAVNTTSSIGILYDHRDQLSMVTKNLLSEIPLLSRYTEKERTSLSKNSPKLLSINHIYNANLRLIEKSKGEPITEQDVEVINLFWSTLCETIPEWEEVLKRNISPRTLRLQSITAQGLFIEAVAEVGRTLIAQRPDSWLIGIKELARIDWSRTNEKDWKGRAYDDSGRIIKNRRTISLTSIRIKQLLNIELNEKEKAMEEDFSVERKLN